MVPWTLLELARTYLETQARLWPELASTPVVPEVNAATTAAMAADFERRFRDQAVEVFEPGAAPRPWYALGVAYVRFSDKNSNPRSLDQQLKRLTDRLDKADATHLEVVIAKADEMGRQLAGKRERLKSLQRAGRRPRVKSVREADVVAALTHLRELLHGDVAVASQVLKALVGDVVIEARMVEGKAKSEMVVRFAINAIPALVGLARGNATAGDGKSDEAWDAVDDARKARAGGEASPESVVVPLKRKCHRAAPDVPVTAGCRG